MQKDTVSDEKFPRADGGGPPMWDEESGCAGREAGLKPCQTQIFKRFRLACWPPAEYCLAPYQHLLVIELRVDMQWGTPYAPVRPHYAFVKGVLVGPSFL